MLDLQGFEPPPKPDLDGPVYAAVYARTSKGTRYEKYSPDEQVERCRARCIERGWIPRYVIVEDDRRADYEVRPKWLALLVRAAAQRFHILVTWKMDRWARSLFDALRTERFLAKHGVAYHSVTEPFDTTTAFGRFAFRSMANVAELERELISERTSMAHEAKRRDHRWHTRRGPLGYEVDEDYRLHVNPNETDQVDLVWNAYRRLLSAPAVAQELVEQGVGTKWGGTWTPHAVYEVLDNELYVGRFHLGDVDDHLEELRIKTDEEFYGMRRLRRRRLVAKPPMSTVRKLAAIDRVYKQYFQDAEQEAREEVAAEIQQIAGARPDPLLLQRILSENRTDREWRRHVAEVITT